MLNNRFYEAIEAIIYIAMNSGANPVSSKDICASQGRLPRHLEPSMQLLVKGGLLKGTKGPKGGYTIAKEKRKITLSDILQILEPEDDTFASSSDINNKIIIPLYKNIKKQNFEYLGKTTIEDICSELRKPDSAKNKADCFNI